MQGMVLTISDSGKVESIYSEEFNLGFLGDQRVFRQTDIVFDVYTQKWDIHYLNEQGVARMQEVIPRINAAYASHGNSWEFARDRKSTRLNSSHLKLSRMPSSA